MDKITSYTMYPYISHLLNESERREAEDVLFDMEARARGYAPVCVANITFTAEQQEELFQRVIEKLHTNRCPDCGAKILND